VPYPDAFLVAAIDLTGAETVLHAMRGGIDLSQQHCHL
jgi:hypothetical protein